MLMIKENKPNGPINGVEEVLVCIPDDEKYPSADRYLPSLNIFFPVALVTHEKVKGNVLYPHFMWRQMFSLHGLARDQLTSRVSRGSFERKQGGIGLVPPALSHRA